MLEKYPGEAREVTLRPIHAASRNIPVDGVRTYAAETELTISDLWRLLMRRRAVVFGTAAAFLALMALYCFFATRRYEATAEIQVQKEQSSPLGLDGSAAPQSDYSDAMQDTMTLQTQASILQSDTLALQVVEELNLEGTPDFTPMFNPIGWAIGFVSPDGPPDPKNASLEESPRRRLEVLNVFSKNLKVKPVSGTRLIDISYLSSNPRTAAAVVNGLTKALADYNFKTRHDATAETADWLSGQLSDLRKQSEDLQTKVANMQRETGVFTLGGTDAQGREQLYSTVLDKLQQATSAYTAAQSNRIAKEAVYKVAQTGDVEALSGMNTAMTGSASGMDTALSLIQSLRMQQSTLKSQLADVSAKFGPAYPKLEQLQSQVDTVGQAIKAEVQRLADRAKNDFQVSKQVETNTQGVYLEQKRQADVLNDKTIEYTILKQEADESRTLYETLFKQLKQAGVLADFKNNNIAVVDPARIPAKPARPRVLLYLLGSLVGGLFFGSCAALLRDTTDSKIRDLPALEADLGVTALGILPFHNSDRSALSAKGAARHKLKSGAETPRRSQPLRPEIDRVRSVEPREFLTFDYPNAPYVEAVRALRTSLLLSRGGSPPKVVLVTSSVAGEGKSMLSVNLAALLAQQQKRVLLIDGDLRRPRLHRAMHVNNRSGLSTYLTGQSEDLDPLSVVIQSRQSDDLFVLPAGPTPPYPSELLGSEQMAKGLAVWRENFDFIVVDGAPVLPVTDSVVLSSMVDFTLLVARYKLTERQSLDRSYRLLLSQTSQNQIGIVMNAVARNDSSYYQYYGYKDSSYFHAEAETKKKKERSAHGAA